MQHHDVGHLMAKTFRRTPYGQSAALIGDPLVSAPGLALLRMFNGYTSTGYLATLARARMGDVTPLVQSLVEHDLIEEVDLSASPAGVPRRN